MTRFIVSETNTPDSTQQAAQTQLLEAALGKISGIKIDKINEQGKNYLVESSLSAKELAIAISTQLDDTALKVGLEQVSGLELLIQNMKQNLHVNQAQ